jgi:hypothetical protein
MACASGAVARWAARFRSSPKPRAMSPRARPARHARGVGQASEDRRRITAQRPAGHSRPAPTCAMRQGPRATAYRSRSTQCATGTEPAGTGDKEHWCSPPHSSDDTTSSTIRSTLRDLRHCGWRVPGIVRAAAVPTTADCSDRTPSCHPMHRAALPAVRSPLRTRRFCQRESLPQTRISMIILRSPVAPSCGNAAHSSVKTKPSRWYIRLAAVLPSVTHSPTVRAPWFSA